MRLKHCALLKMSDDRSFAELLMLEIYVTRNALSRPSHEAWPVAQQSILYGMQIVSVQ